MHVPRWRWWTRWALLACLACPVSPALAYLVNVVGSNNGLAFQEASDSLVQELARNGLARKDIGLLSVAEYQELAAGAPEARLTVSLGTEAFRQVIAGNTSQPYWRH